jgi:hypothetical protein
LFALGDGNGTGHALLSSISSGATLSIHRPLWHGSRSPSHSGGSANVTTSSLGKGRPKAIVRRQAIDHANTIAVKAMMICRASLSVMAVTPTGAGVLNISLRQAL